MALTLEQRIALMEHCLETDKAALAVFANPMFAALLPPPNDEFLEEKKKHIKDTEDQIAEMRKQLKEGC